ncbi:MAG: C25 family cysteine peptidase [Bacteroidales bacterium]|nr:C25 family cysteine peptidase [Bacteroidales bacterium]
MIKKFTVVVSLLLAVLWLKAGVIEKTVYLEAPELVKTKNGDLLQFHASFMSGMAGEPTLPWQKVSLLLPPGEEAVSVELTIVQQQKLDQNIYLAPYQSSRPLSEKRPSDFLKKETVYRSNENYPATKHGKLTTNWLNGMGLAFCIYTPVSYFPASGELYYATEVKITITTKPSNRNAETAVWLNQTTKQTLETLIQNPEAIKNYVSKSRELADYDMLIITPESYFEQFQPLIELYYQRGFRVQLAAIEVIESEMTGVDLQEKIRNYIIQEYNEHGIQHVTIGGDVQLIPARGLYCYVESGSGYSDDGIPADLYYAALDGTWNDNNNNRWGEPGEDDLLPELGIARMPFATATELANMLNKTMMYQQQPVLGELEKPLFAGENLYSNPATWGRDYLELLVGETSENGYTTKGIPESYEIERMYEFNSFWSGNDLINSINQGKQFVHHVGHANQTYVAHLYNSDITASNFSATNGVDHNFTLFHSHGCDCGAFDYNDCILEKMVLIENFAVAVIGNSRYGWFNEGQTEGPSAHLHREMTDAFYNDKIPFMGMALRESKIQTAPWVTAPGQWEEGALRWNFYDLNILGDGLLSVWTSEPFVPELSYTAELIIGLSETTVNLQFEGEALAGYRCHIRQDGEIIGLADTDANGNAVISFYEPLNQTGEAELVIVGQNILPSIFPILILPNEGPYVIWTSMEVVDETGNENAQADYGETISLNIGLKNIGSETVENVELAISINDDLIVAVLDGEAIAGNISAGETLMLSDVFQLEISEMVPPMSSVEILMAITAGNQSWDDSFMLEILTPKTYISSYLIDDAAGNQNGMLDPGETVELHVTGGNAGGSAAADLTLSLSTEEWLTIDNPVVQIGNLLPGETFEAVFTVHVDEYTPIGSIVLANFHLDCPVGDWYYDAHQSWLLPIGMQIEDFETGDFTKYEWRHGLGYPWQIVEDEVYEGNFAAKSTAISGSQSSELHIRLFVMQADEISFYRKVSSESGYDHLRFYVDDVKLGEWSGEKDWELVTAQIPEGEHLLKWVYIKDFSVSNGDDCAWIDYITFPGTATIMDVQQHVRDNKFSVYPNPGVGEFWVSVPSNQDVKQLIVYDLHGKRLVQENNFKASSSLDLTALKTGIYVMILETQDAVFTEKLLIK